MSKTGLPVELSLSVAWGHMDAFEHVNNTVYFRYFEDARIAYFREVGMFEEMDKSGQGPILASTQCRFKIPLKYPEEVTVGASVRDLRADRFTMHYRVYSKTHDAIAAEGTGLIIYFDYGVNKKATMPDNILENIQRIESGQAEMSMEGN